MRVKENDDHAGVNPPSTSWRWSKSSWASRIGLEIRLHPL